MEKSGHDVARKLANAVVLLSCCAIVVAASHLYFVFERGEGAYLFDSHGRRYLDWVQGWAVNCLGHAPKVVAEALAPRRGEATEEGTARS